MTLWRALRALNPYYLLNLILGKVFRMSITLDALKQAEADAEARILKAVEAIAGTDQLRADLAAAQAAFTQAQTDASAADAAAQATIDDLTAKLNAAIAKLPAA